MTNREKYCKCIKNIRRFLKYCIIDCFKRIYAFILFLLCIKPKKEEENKTDELSKLEENSDIKNLKENLNRYLKDSSSKGFVISIKGNWGVGKTFFWNIYAKENLDEKKYVYISLFGINKLDDIKTKILNKISKQANIVNKTKGFFGSSRIVGVDIGAVISIFGIKNFKDIVVCFDDFERLSPNLNISEVLGVISELKEQYSCKIVIINNNDQLEELDSLNSKKLFSLSANKESKKQEYEERHRYSILQTNNHEIFEKYLEKIVDVEYEYFPEVKYQIELFKKINSDKKYLNWDLLVRLFNELQEDKKRNIRLMKHYFMKLEILEDILKIEVLKDLESFIIDEFLIKIFEELFNITILNIDVIAFKSVSNLNNINRLYIKEIVKNTIVDKEKIKQKILEDIEIARKNLKEKNESEKEAKEFEERKKLINETYLNYMYDLKYDGKKFVDDMYKLLNNEENIMWMISFNTFTFYIKDFFIKLDKDREEEFKKFYIEKSKIFIKNGYQSMQRYFFEEADFLNQDIRKELEEYYNKLNQNDFKDTKTNQIDILKIIKSIYKDRRTYNKEEESILNQIKKEEHKDKLIQNREYFEATFDLMNWLKGFSGNKPFNNFYNTTVEVYKELFKEDNYKHKMKFVLNNFGIKTENDNKEELIDDK